MLSHIIIWMASIFKLIWWRIAGLRKRGCWGRKELIWWAFEGKHYAFILGTCSFKATWRCTTWNCNARRWSISRNLLLFEFPISDLSKCQCYPIICYLLDWYSSRFFYFFCFFFMQLQYLVTIAHWRWERSFTFLLLGISEAVITLGVGSL